VSLDSVNLIRGRIGIVENRGRSTVVLGAVAGPKEVKGRKGFGIDLGIIVGLTITAFTLEGVF